MRSGDGTTRYPPRLRLLPVAVAAWLTGGILIGIPDAAPAVALGLASLAAGVAIAAPRVLARVVVVVALAACVAVAVSAGIHQAGREPTALATAADEGRSLDVTIVVGGRTTEGRFAGTISGAPVLVFGEIGDSWAIGSSVTGRVAVVRADPGDDVAFLVRPRGTLTVAAGPPPLLAWADGQRSGFLRLTAVLPDPGGVLLPGLATGDTSRVPAELDTAMKVSSLSHLTAVSGANCAIVVGAVLAVAGLLGAPLPVRVAVAALALLGFVVLVTPEPSVLRAAVMAGLALGALATGRPSLGMPLLCAAVAVLLVVDPWLARSYGFALSALATAGLLLFAGPLARVLGRVLPTGLATVLAVPIAAQLACQPVLLMLDPSLPLYGVPANLLAEPAAPLATVLGLLACLLGGLAPPLGTALAWLGWLPAAWIAAVAELFAGLPGARSAWPVGPLGIGLLVLVEVALLVALLGRGRSRRVARAVSIVALIAYAATLAGGYAVVRLTRPVDWQYAMCDVGQGDATLVRSGDAVALVDLGPDPVPLRSCLDDLGIHRLDLVVLTHFDLDHVGGADAVLGRADLVLTGPTDGAADEALRAALADHGARVVQAERGDRGTLGDLEWEVLWPPPRGVEPGNPASVTLEWSCTARAPDCLTSVMLGDLGQEAQARMSGAAHPGPVDVVKVAHHGSADQSPELYASLAATVGLIGVGADNDYGHPTDALLGILAATGTTALRTDRDGLILLAPGDDAGEVDVWTSG